MYFSSEEAEELKRTYSSWLGKQAHVGNGVTDTLLSIRIVPGKTYPAKKKVFLVEFEFSNGKKFSAPEFLFYNGLLKNDFHPLIPRRPDNAA